MVKSTSLERGTSRKANDDRCAVQDVHVDPSLPICKDCLGETWWHSQQKNSLPSWRSASGRCFVSHTALGLHQWYSYHCNKEGLKHTTRMQEAISSVNKWILDWGSRGKYQQNKQQSLLTFHLKGTGKAAAERWDSAPGRHPHLPLCEAVHTPYLEATDREDGEKQSAETSLDEKACRTTRGADSSILTKVQALTV